MTLPTPTGRLAPSIAAALLGALTLFGSALLLPGAGAETGGSITLIGQSPWVDDEGALAVDLRVTGSIDDGLLTFRLHEAVGTGGLLGGALLEREALPEPVGSPVTSQLADSLGAGGVASLVLDIGPGSALPTSPGSVHPLSILLTSTSGEILDSVHTMVIHLPDGRPPFPLLTALAIDIAGPPPLQPDGTSVPDPGTVSSLRSVIDALIDHPLVAADLRLPPATVVALAQSGETAHGQLLDDLIDAVGGRIRLASSPFVTADPEAWRQAERPDIYQDILDHGDLALADEIGMTPNRAIAHLPPSGVAETLDLLSHLGSQRFIVSAEHLEPRPADLDSLTQPVRLRGESGSPFTALVVDPQLARHLLGPYGPVASVQFLLADLAVRSWAEPVVPRLAVIAISDPTALEGLLLDVLLGALEEAPFVDLAPLPAVFSSLTTLDPGSITEATLWPEAVASNTAKVRDRGLVEVTIEAYASLVGGRRPEIARLDDLLEATSAAEVTTEQGEPYLRAVYDAVVVVLDAFEAPDDQNVLLTSRRATVPFTVENSLPVPAHVRLHLESDGRLDFPEGDTLDVTLSPGSNRIPILVEARTSGDARLLVTVRSPDTSELLQLQSSTLLVRSTQLSGVGVFLLAGALLVLGVWWFRSARNGRPNPSDDYAAPDPGEDP
ncbi:MAG: DUF6049 family protein [Acidimicrobiales bacterium]|nr:hypothetical protein [Acidimicrobiaceae bacterium]MDP6648840.1 DUF6049 family protein [Acidimicrobiales bacterium]MDP6759252.1 DUF6049 family protein [Acidimicrobiales bacterium]|tara:strand:- start:329 stop:2332 length:2004 start_codon:yes stop_codon:yes gene_type:complete